MRSILLSLLAVFISVNVFSQGMPQIDGVKMVTREDYRAADTVALQVANYILSTPIEKNNVAKLNGTKFLLDWMGGTPDFTFALNDQVLKCIGKDLDLTGVFMASLASSALQDKSVKDSKAITLLAAKKFVAYISNSDNKVDVTRQLTKMMEADKKGELETFLKL